MDIHQNIRQYYNDIKLSADIMHVNNIPFLASILDNIHYGTADAINNLQCPTLEAQINKVIRKYTVRGFCIKMITVDIQFKSLKDRNACTTLFNIVSREEYVPKIERWHRVVKERMRCYFAMAPFDYLPRILIV